MQIYLTGTIIATAAITIGLILAFRHRGTSSPNIQQRMPLSGQTSAVAPVNRIPDNPNVESSATIVGLADEQVRIPEGIAAVLGGSAGCSTHVLDIAESEGIETEIKQEEMAVPDVFDHLLTQTADSIELHSIEIVAKQGAFAVDVSQPLSGHAASTAELPKDEEEAKVETQGMRLVSNLPDEPVRESSQSYSWDGEWSAAQIEVTRSIRDGSRSSQTGISVTAPSDSCSAATARPSIAPNPVEEPDVRAGDPQTNPDTRETARPPSYHPPAPPSGLTRMTGQRERLQPQETTLGGELRLRLQLVFGRGGSVKVLALIPDRRDGMASEVHLVDTEADLCLIQLRDDSYEPVLLPDAENTLQRGVAWCGNDAGRRWRWTMSGREIYVLAPGDEFGFHGFVSIPRLQLNGRHVVLCTMALRDVVFAALEDAGCNDVAMSDETTTGVPSGWVLFRDVTPTRGVAMIDEKHILNVLCPSHDAELHFVGGIRLERNNWLIGFPPRIRLTGEVYDGFKVMIDGQPASCAADSTYEAPEWNVVGEHKVVFGNRTTSYQLSPMFESWEHWPAHDFGRGAVLCGAAVRFSRAAKSYSVRIPATNQIILGHQPGEVFYFRSQIAARCDTCIAVVPFEPVWALPADTLHVDKRTARVVLLNPIAAPVVPHHVDSKNYLSSSVVRWIMALNDARRKQLAVDPRTDEAVELWRQYRTLAKQMWRKMR